MSATNRSPPNNPSRSVNTVILGIYYIIASIFWIRFALNPALLKKLQPRPP